MINAIIATRNGLVIKKTYTKFETRDNKGKIKC